MKELIVALNAAYKECGYVQKKGKMDAAGAKYRYAKEADFIEVVRPALINNGLTMAPSGVSSLHHTTYNNKNGTPTHRVVGVFTFRLSHISGQSMDVSSLGEGVDTGDKASYKAMTGALKYALRQTLIIETGDDPDNQTPEAPAAGPSHAEKEARQKAERKIAEIRTALAPLDSFEQAAWLQENPNEMAALQWIKRNFPDLYEEISGLGVEV